MVDERTNFGCDYSTCVVFNAPVNSFLLDQSALQHPTPVVQYYSDTNCQLNAFWQQLPPNTYTAYYNTEFAAMSAVFLFDCPGLKEDEAAA